MDVIKSRVLETSNCEGLTEESNTNNDNEFVEIENYSSSVDEVEIDRTNNETDETIERTEEQKCMLEKIVGILRSGEKCYCKGFQKVNRRKLGDLVRKLMKFNVI